MTPSDPPPQIDNRPVGRPPALDATRREIAIALVAVGCTRTQAARYLEVSPQTMFNTARRDPEFARQLEQAEADLRWKHLRNVHTASGRSWRASAWALQQLADIEPQGLPYPPSRSSSRTDT